MPKCVTANNRKQTAFDTNSVGSSDYKLQISAKLHILSKEINLCSPGRSTLLVLQQKRQNLSSSSATTVGQQWLYLEVQSGNIWVISTVSNISRKLPQDSLDKHCKLLTIAGQRGTYCLLLFPHARLFLKTMNQFPVISQIEIKNISCL